MKIEKKYAVLIFLAISLVTTGVVYAFMVVLTVDHTLTVDGYDAVLVSGSQTDYQAQTVLLDLTSISTVQHEMDLACLLTLPDSNISPTQVSVDVIGLPVNVSVTFDVYSSSWREISGSETCLYSVLEVSGAALGVGVPIDWSLDWVDRGDYISSGEPVDSAHNGLILDFDFDVSLFEDWGDYDLDIEVSISS